MALAAMKAWPLHHHLLPFFLFFFTLTAAQYSIHDCSTTAGNYTGESLFRADLTTLLASLSSNLPPTGFYSSSAGDAHAAALCRPDIQPASCRGCVKIAAADLLSQCPDHLEAIIWYEYCSVRYSNRPILASLATGPVQFLRNNFNNFEIPAARAALMAELRLEAAAGGALVKASAGSRAGAQGESSNETVYGLVQCSPELSPENCTRCLKEAASVIPTCCNASGGARVYMPSCNVRYELGSFFNATRLQELVALSLSSPSPPPIPETSFSKGGRHAGRGSDDEIRNIVIVVVSIVAFLTLAFVFGFFLRKKIKHKTKQYPKVEEFVEIRTVESIQYEFHNIKAATNNFSDDNALGQGGFGIVYKGKLENGKEIAVKRLSKDLGQGEAEFKNEVLLVAKLQHRNLVRLLGFSVQGIERLLVYEFVPNGSLDRFLFDGVSNSFTLNWDIRYKIIGGIARGLVYLHEDSRLRIIHRDLKASNVLLDEEMNPKISDFGLAKLVLGDATQASASRIVGTYGYMAPEYAMVGRFSIKSDVYSFGVLVLEIVSGQKRMQNGTAGDLLTNAWRNWRGGTSAKIIDPILKANSEMLKCIHIALLCIQENPNDRPTVASVVQMLNTSPSLPLPSPTETERYASRVSRCSISHDPESTPEQVEADPVQERVSPPLM